MDALSGSHNKGESKLPLSGATFWINSAITLAVLVVAISLFQPVFDWSWNQLERAERQYHVLICLAFILLCACRLVQEKRTLRFASRNVPSTLIVCVACTTYLLNRYYLQLNALSLVLFLVFSYGLLGHFVSKQTWRSCLLPLLLTMLVLPFEGYLDIFLGFPMRLLAADTAVDVLHVMGIASVSTDTVLLIDNRAAIVDIDCSGIRGFWIGSVFLCAITWVERYRMDLRWLLIALFAALVLFFGNVLRIVALVMLDLVLNKAELAQEVHESLGLVSFAFALLVSWLLLRKYGRKHESVCERAKVVDTTLSDNAKQLFRNDFSATTLMLLSLVMVFNFILVNQPVHAKTATRVEVNFQLPSQRYKISQLNALEQRFFIDNAANANKYSTGIEYEGNFYKASVLLVSSRNWKAQHTPENCYLAQGYKISSSEILRVGNGANVFSSRSLALHKSILDSNTPSGFIGDYWFQSASTTTANLAHRVFAQLRSPDKPWVMASVLWQESVPDAARLLLLQEINSVIKRKMENHG